ncbi:hypothetical protein [Flavobacterium sp. IMCC34518]|uniref:hypothetical protein n=1 Tax=Flavobacterium sp. IMCC34518 TaxID=3003623 RepID=UPI0024825619|nr:hypothetical protein [Flavobacterium sp. IMCC34518]
MKINNNAFFKKHKIIKIILLVHLAISLLISISEIVHGYIDGNVKQGFEKNFQNGLALYNQDKYLAKDFFVVDTAYIEIHASPSHRSTTTYTDNTVIKGHLLHSKFKQEMICNYKNSAILNDTSYQEINNKKVKILEVLRNRINDNVFLEDKQYIKESMIDAVSGIYLLISIIPLVLILLIKSK